jgi:hypothetical protein
VADSFSRVVTGMALGLRWNENVVGRFGGSKDSGF